MKSPLKLAAFIATSALLIAGLTYTSFAAPQYIKDYCFALALIAVLYLAEKRHPLPLGLVIAGCIALMLPVIGGLTFGWFAFYAYGIGYDKMLHFTTALVMVLLFFHWIESRSRRKAIILHVLTAMVLVMGLNALNEITEFVGSQYMHVSGPSMFSQGDLLPPTLQNDLVKYDTWWDLIFDLFGATAGAIIALAIPWKKHARNKRRSRTRKNQ